MTDFMRDPSTSHCRIYVGNLKENTQKAELQNIFGKYGKIRGIMISRNFGFVQFENEQSVQNAITNENQNMYNNRSIVVSKVQPKSNKGKGNAPNASMNNAPIDNAGPNNSPMNAGINRMGKPPSNTNQNPSAAMNSSPNEPSMLSGPGQQPMNMNNMGNKQKINNNVHQNMPHNPNQMQNQGPNMNQNVNMNQSMNPNMNMNQNQSSLFGTHQPRQQWRNNRNNNNRNNSNNNEMNLHTDRERSPFDGGRDGNNTDRWNQDSGNNFRNNNRQNFMNQRNSNNQQNMDRNYKPPDLQFPGPNKDVPKTVLNGGVLRGYASAREVRARFPNANDCEIVVLEKHLVDYAEYIEGRLKRLGMTADLLFPNAGLTHGKMLLNVANRGSLFAIIVGPQNRDMKSIIVNILYGIPSEHRNIPIDDGIEMIYRNYEQLRQGEAGDFIGDTDESPYAAIPLAKARHPDSIQHLTNLLADNRTLTVLQYDSLLKYLQERREAQNRFEQGDTEATDVKENTAEMQKASQEEEMQRKILEILNKPTIPNIKSETPQVNAIKSEVNTPFTEVPKTELKEPSILSDPSVKNSLDSLFDV